MKIKTSVIFMFCCVFLVIAPVSAYTTRTALDKYQNGPGADAIVISDDLTFRAEPSTNSLVVSVLNNGERLAIIRQVRGNDGDYWLLVIRSNGSIGWVNQRYVQTRC